MQPGTMITTPAVLRSLEQSPANTIANALAPTVRAWAKPKGSPSHVLSGRGRAEQALGLVAAALKSLGKRKGAREDAARAWLDSTAAAITNAIAAFETIGEDCDGPAALALIERLAQVRGQRDAAQSTLDAALDSASMRRAREQIDEAAVAMREHGRDLRALIAAATLPSLPAPEAFRDAELDTLELARAAKQGRRPATTLADALEQGARAAAPSDDPGAVARASLVARLWVVYEGAEPAAADVFAWRHRRYLEGRPEPKPVEDAPTDPLSLSYAQTKELATLLVDAKEIAQLKWQGLSDDQVRTLSRAGLLRDEQRADWEARP